MTAEARETRRLEICTQLHALTKEFEEQAASAEAADENDCRAAWRTWVKSALSAGGRKAHQWAKGPQLWILDQIVGCTAWRRGRSCKLNLSDAR